MIIIKKTFLGSVVWCGYIILHYYTGFYQDVHHNEAQYDCSVFLFPENFHQTIRDFSTLHNVWWLPCMWMDFVNQTLEPTNQHIHSGMCRQFTDVNAVTKCTMTSCTMANTVENTRSASRKSTPISDRFIALKIVGLAVNSKAYVVTQW